jgi:hypothetical protein
MDEAHEKGSKTRKTRVYEKYVMPLEKRKSYSERMTSNNPMYDSTIKERHKEKMNSPEIKRKRAEISKGNTYVKGKSWYNNGIECKMLHEAPEGWAKGRLNPHWNHNRKNNA